MLSSALIGLAERTAEDILRALSDSTWREHHPGAYDDLLYYKEDIIKSIEAALSKETT